MNEMHCSLLWHVVLEVGETTEHKFKDKTPPLISVIGVFSTDDATSLPPQVLVLLFTHHLHPGGDGPPRQIETPADQRAAGQAVGAQQHRQQLQPEGKSHMRLRDAEEKKTLGKN